MRAKRRCRAHCWTGDASELCLAHRRRPGQISCGSSWADFRETEVRTRMAVPSGSSGIGPRGRKGKLGACFEITVQQTRAYQTRARHATTKRVPWAATAHLFCNRATRAGLAGPAVHTRAARTSQATARAGPPSAARPHHQIHRAAAVATVLPPPRVAPSCPDHSITATSKPQQRRARIHAGGVEPTRRSALPGAALCKRHMLAAGRSLPCRRTRPPSVADLLGHHHAHELCTETAQ